MGCIPRSYIDNLFLMGLLQQLWKDATLFNTQNDCIAECIQTGGNRGGQSRQKYAPHIWSYTLIKFHKTITICFKNIWKIDHIFCLQYECPNYLLIVLWEEWIFHNCLGELYLRCGSPISSHTSIPLTSSNPWLIDYPILNP